ncbi:MAG TPA: protein-glutamate O-methyltransferase CheR [Candidatus Nitrosotalea sp.]|nr:protein-glutamate O-methyltransferase CheR [Candidatus Nitrosotalea sp.]
MFESYGSDIKRYKPSFMKRRLDRRMRILEINDYFEYADILKKERYEFEELFASLSINVTNFFRDFIVYDKFRSLIIPKILNNLKPKEKIQVWSAGCASGEEAYSLAMLFSHVTNKFDVKIIASDINKKAIEYAFHGKYPEKSIEKLPPDIIASHFQKTINSENIIEYEVMQHIKNLVTFNACDILSNNVSNLDVIFCRNVLIYYEKEAQELILEKFNRCLNQHGYLVLGMDETLLGRRSEQFFYPMASRERIYQKHASK